MLALESMTGPRAQSQAEPAEHPLRAALALGERAHAHSGPALQHLLAAPHLSLIDEALVAQVRGMLTHVTAQLVDACVRPDPEAGDAVRMAMMERMLREPELRAHCQALALEWRLARQLERELALDPVLSPLMQASVAQGDAATGALAMAALAAQARFAQVQRRMELPLAELPAELFHTALAAAREVLAIHGSDTAARGEARRRGEYDEAASRLALLARLARAAGSVDRKALTIEEAGVALWLSALAAASGESRDRTAGATADPHLGRLLLTLRAAGLTGPEAERQALRVQPDAIVPRGLEEIGTREAALWLAEAGP